MMKIWILTAGGILNYENRRMAEEFSAIGSEVHEIIINDLEFVTGSDKIYYQNEPVELPDIVTSRVKVVGNYYAESVLRELEIRNVIVVNPISAIQICRDKLLTLQVLSQHGVPIIKTYLPNLPMRLDDTWNKLEFPLIAKTYVGSLGSGVFLAKSINELQSMMRVFRQTGSNVPLLLQEYLKNDPQQEMRVMVAGGKAIYGFKRVAQNDDFRTNLSKGGLALPCSVPSELEARSEKIASIIDLHVAGIDYLYKNGEWMVCEVNSSPGFNKLEHQVSVNIAEMIVQSIKEVL